MIGKVVGIEIEEEAVNGQGIMIVGAEIVIVVMIEIVKERETGPAAMIQGVVGDHVHGQGRVLGAMIAIGFPFYTYIICLIHEIS